MLKLSIKQHNFLELLIKFYIENKKYPSLNDIKKISNYKSYKTIYKYLNLLEEKEYIKYDKLHREITFIKMIKVNETSLSIPFIGNCEYLNLKNDKENYIVKVKDNYLKNYGILRNDLVVVTNDLSHLNNKFVIIKNNNKYKIYKYEIHNGFHYLLNDKETLIFENTNLIYGKVLSLIRKT